MRIASADQPRVRRAPRIEPVIVFSVGLETFAIAASAVLEIGSTDSMAATASAFSHPQVPKVRHTLERGARTYYVVTACAYFGMPTSRPSMILLLNDSRTAVLVDRIERMTEANGLYELPRAFAGEERSWYRGLAILNDRVVPVVNPAAFLTASEIALLDSAARTKVPERPSPAQGAVRA
jgi:chemotaxis signal transduction protein